MGVYLKCNGKKLAQLPFFVIKVSEVKFFGGIYHEKILGNVGHGYFVGRSNCPVCNRF
jgi:hypothetical protein